MGIVFILVVVDTKRDTDTRLEGAIGKTNKRQALKSKMQKYRHTKCKCKREVDKRPTKKGKYKNEEVKK